MIDRIATDLDGLSRRPAAVGAIGYAPLTMAHARRVELDDLVNRPGTYFNPQTEVLVVVDDSPELDSEIFNLEEFEGADWIQISDEVPVDEQHRDELLEAVQVHLHAGSAEEEEAGADSSDELEEDDQEAGRE